MRNHFLKTIIALCCLLGCTGCFDLQEHLFLKKDGSGNFSFVINLSEFTSLMNMFGDTGTEQGSLTINQSPKDKMNSAFESTKKKLLQIKGISNVNTIEDSVHYTFGLSFDFKNIDALNTAMNRLFEEDSLPAGSKATNYFEWKDNKLTRLDVLDSKSLIGRTATLSDEQKGMANLFSLDKLFESVSYSTDYEFEDKIAASDNTEATLSSNSKKISVKCYPFAIPTDSTQKKCTIANTITLK